MEQSEVERARTKQKGGESVPIEYLLQPSSDYPNLKSKKVKADGI